MKVLFDNCVPDVFLGMFATHEAKHARDCGWDELANGHLLKVADEAGFQVLLTIDRKMRFQSSLKGLTICVAAVENAQNSKARMAKVLEEVIANLETLAAGEFHVFRPSDSPNDENVP